MAVEYKSTKSQEEVKLCISIMYCWGLLQFGAGPKIVDVFVWVLPITRIMHITQGHRSQPGCWMLLQFDSSYLIQHITHQQKLVCFHTQKMDLVVNKQHLQNFYVVRRNWGVSYSGTALPPIQLLQQVGLVCNFSTFLPSDLGRLDPGCWWELPSRINIQIKLYRCKQK